MDEHTEIGEIGTGRTPGLPGGNGAPDPPPLAPWLSPGNAGTDYTPRYGDGFGDVAGPSPLQPGASGAAEPEAPARWRPPRWLKVFGGVTVFLAIALVVGSTVRLDYYSIAPGDSYETLPLVGVEGAPTFDHDGSLYMTTVSVTPVTLLEWVATRLDSDAVLVPSEQIDGGKSDKEVDEVNQALMDGSKLNAEAVAFEKLGIPVTFTGSGALIVEVAEDVPAADLLERGDVVKSVNGTPVKIVTDLTALLAPLPAGTSVSLVVERDGRERTVDVPLVANPEAPGKAMVGIVVQTADFDVESPVEVTIDSRNVGGPSAGLVYTLTIIDRLSPEDLTHGRRVAATGEMSLDGTVGAIGGVEQKVSSVEGVDADLFLVPDGNCDAAKEKAESVEVVCVSNIDEALAALDALPPA
ncbi:MAG: PDZ domain-containing protein [Acidimicrobiia bacterium]|nr:PDZ domain-containing protein [Acidimicrobiia bacterium]